MENTTDSTVLDLIIVGMLLAFVLSTAIILFVFFYQRKLANQRNRLQNVKIEHQKNLIHATLKAVEHERQQFAANLHDEIGAHLSIAKMTLSSSIGKNVSANQPVSSAVDILEEVIHSVHSISHNLFPPVLSKLGLEKAIASYLKKIPEGSIKLNFACSGMEQRFDKEVELHTFRIFQESISNALKHSKADAIHVELHPRGSLFTLKISDNGKGLVASTDRIGLGFEGMRSRSEIINFEIQFNSSSDGFSILLTPKSA